MRMLILWLAWELLEHGLLLGYGVSLWLERRETTMKH
jgi:hypothetical protein